MKTCFCTLLTALAFVLAPAASVAGGDHDHGHASGPSAPSVASPRLEARSDLFELVGVAEKGQLTIYLDRYATNEPVKDARIEFESGDHKGVAASQTDGTYSLALPGLDKPGQFALSFTVTVGPDTDLLAGDLTLPDSPAQAPITHRPWSQWAVLAAAVLAALALAFAAGRQSNRRPA